MIGNANKLLNYPDRLRDLNDGKPVIPVTIELHISNSCNHNCKYCDIKHEQEFMSQHMIQNIIYQAMDLGVEGIVLSGGGEPMCGLINEFIDCPIPCGLITNGSCGHMSEELLRSFEWIRYSVDSCHTKTYEAIRGVPLGSSLIANIIASSFLTTTGVQMVICKENINECDDMADWVKWLGADYLYIRPDDYCENPPWPDKLPKNGLKIITRQDKLSVIPASRCYAGNFIITIDPGGKCYVCACGGLKYLIGELHYGDSALRDVIYGERRSCVLSKIKPANCKARCKGSNINHAFDICGKHREFL